MNTPHPQPVARAALRIPIRLRQWDAWIKPRSTDPDTAFRENTIRITSAILVIILGVATPFQFAISALPGTSPGILIVILVALGLSLASAYIVHRQHVLAAGYLLTATWIAISFGLMIINGVTSIPTAPTLILTLIMAALVLPRQNLIPVVGICLIGTASLAILEQTLLPRAEMPTTPVVVFLSASFSLSLAVLLLRQLVTEFDNRLTTEQAARREADTASKQAVAAKEEALAANRVKSQFLANMSHELRTPLNAINGYTDIMLGGMAGTLDAKQIDILQKVNENGKRLHALINDILDLSRIEAGRTDLRLESVEPKKLLATLVQTLQSLATQKHLTLTIDVQPSTPEVVISDPSKVQQIVTNLLGNALKFTRQGSITLELSAHTPDSWQIKVTDTGIGIPANALPSIFDIFQQVDSEDTRTHEGTGLGLAITKRLAEHLKGSITVQSTLDVGSTFIVTLPRTLILPSPNHTQPDGA